MSGISPIDEIIENARNGNGAAASSITGARQANRQRANAFQSATPTRAQVS